MTTVLGSKRTFLDASDEEAMDFIETVCDITAIPEYQKLKEFRHHYVTSRYQHCLNVAWYTYLWCRHRGLNYRSAARGAMLHDFFLYDWRIKEQQPIPGGHCTVHPMVALANAEKYFEIDEIMRDCIVNHMWPSSPNKPLTKEGMVVVMADKYCASMEMGLYSTKKISPLFRRLIKQFQFSK